MGKFRRRIGTLLTVALFGALLNAGPAAADDTEEFALGAPGAVKTTELDNAAFSLDYADHLTDRVDPWKCYVQQPFLVHQRRTEFTSAIDVGYLEVNCHNRNLASGPITVSAGFEFFNRFTRSWLPVPGCDGSVVIQPTNFGQGVAQTPIECRYATDSSGLGSWHRFKVDLDSPVDLLPTYSQPSFAFSTTAIDIGDLTCLHLDCPSPG